MSVDSRLRFIAKTPGEEPPLPSHVRLSRRFAPHTFFAAGRRGPCCPWGSSPGVLTPAQRARRRAPQPARRGRDGDPRLQRWGAGGAARAEPLCAFPGDGRPRRAGGRRSGARSARGARRGPGLGSSLHSSPGECRDVGCSQGKATVGPRSRTPRVTERMARGRSPRRQHSERLGTPATCPRWPPLVPSPRRAPQADRGFIN